MPSPQRLHGEPSPSQRRRLAKSMPSLRQLVEPSARRKPIQRNDSVNPQMHFRQFPKKLQKNYTSASVNIKKRFRTMLALNLDVIDKDDSFVCLFHIDLLRLNLVIVLEGKDVEAATEVVWKLDGAFGTYLLLVDDNTRNADEMGSDFGSRDIA